MIQFFDGRQGILGVIRGLYFRSSIERLQDFPLTDCSVFGLRKVMLMTVMTMMAMWKMITMMMGMW